MHIIGLDGGPRAVISQADWDALFRRRGPKRDDDFYACFVGDDESPADALSPSPLTEDQRRAQERSMRPWR